MAVKTPTTDRIRITDHIADMCDFLAIYAIL